jgi:hypothetical protein
VDTTTQVGRVIRFGRSWADVTIGHKVHRVYTRPDLLIRVGCYLKIVNKQGIAILKAGEQHQSDLLQ